MEVAKTDPHRYIELFYNRERSARLQAVSTLGYMSPVAIYNANGAKIYEYAYDAWGNMIRSTAAPGYMAQGNAANEVNPFRMPWELDADIRGGVNRSHANWAAIPYFIYWGLISD